MSRLQGAHGDLVRRRNIRAVAPAYADSQAAAFDWLLAFCEEAGVPIERRDAFSYASSPDGRYQIAYPKGVDAVLVPYALEALRSADQALEIDRLLLEDLRQNRRFGHMVDLDDALADAIGR